VLCIQESSTFCYTRLTFLSRNFECNSASVCQFNSFFWFNNCCRTVSSV